MRNHVLPIVTRAAADEENARFLTEQKVKSRKRLVAQDAHLHPCNHHCFCYDPTSAECRGCIWDRLQTAQVAFHRRLMAIRPDDALTTEALLERRA